MGGRPARTGIIATANTPGTAVDVSALNDIAVVADSDAGVAVFNVFNGMSPTLIAQVDTPGDAQQVAISGNLVAVADGSSGLAVVDITDPPAASIVHQIDLGGSAKAVAAGIAYVLTSKPPQLVAVDLVGGTVLDRLFLSGTVQDVALGKDHLYVLTVNTKGTIATLHAISLDTFQVVGSATSPRGLGSVAVRHRLSVGNDIAYAVQPRGYNTFSLDDPKRPALIAVGTTTQLGWKQIAPNGSGLGLAAVGPNVSFDGIHNVSLYDVSDPARTDVFLTEFETPGVARSVSIFNGLAYVADHGSGLQVINYLAYDILGVPPTISLSTNFAPGVAEEGHLMRVTAEVSDDVQVRNVEFFLDGERVVTDGNFPFEHRFVTPLIIDQPSFTLRARANDTGGNFTLTDEITVTLVPDATPPRVNRVSPPPGSNLPPPPESVATLSATFNELIDHPTISGATFRLFSPGPDGIAGNADDEPVQGGVVSYLADINTAFLTFDAVLPSSRYRAVLSPPIADLAGNPLAEEHAWTFDVGRLVSWITTADGSWHDPANWSIGALPGAGDFVSIDVDGDITVTHSQSNTSIYNLESRDTLAISGGTLSVATDSTIAALNMSGGTLNIAESLSATDINVSGGNLVVERVLSAAASVTLDSVTATVNVRLNAQDVALLNGSTLTHRQSRVADGPTGVPRLEIDATSSIDVTAKGYLGNGRGDNTSSRGRTIGNATGSRDGGSYGGRGGGSSNGVYGDYQDPNHLGSGGGGNNSGGSCGGLVRITADTLVMDGAIRAVGGLGGAGIGASSGNGSGGGIRIDTRILSGDGVISAEGGEQSGRQGGGGGRIAIYYQDISGFDTSNISARGGGGKGGAGTIYLKGTAQANGDLIIDNVGVVSQHSTGLRSVAPGVSTGLEANTLTDGTASFSVPNPVTGRVGLIGLELNPDTTQGQTFTIIGNTATQIFTDPADGAMTDVAMSGDGYVCLFFSRQGYVVVDQDCRARFALEGEDYSPLRQEIQDGYDTIEWAARLPWSNGLVGTIGQSYLGATQYTLALTRIHRCGAALGLEQGVRAVGRDGPRSIPINGAGGGLWLELVAPMAVLGSGAGAGSAGQHAREDNRGAGRCDSVGWLSSLVDVSGAVGAVRQAMAGLAIEPGRE